MMISSRPSIAFILLALCAALVAGGCRRTDHADRREAAEADLRALAEERASAPEGLLELQKAVELALEHNLRTAMARQRRLMAEKEAAATRLDRLGQLKATLTTSKRGELRATASESLHSGHQTLSPSFSTEKRVSTSRIEATWNLIDFGLAYLRSRQADSEAAIKGWEERRSRQRLAMEVSLAWWRAASAEALAPPAAELARKARTRLEERTAAAGETLSDVQVLEYQHALAKAETRLTEIRQRRGRAIARLRRLLNLKPEAELAVAPLSLAKTPAMRENVDVAGLEREALRQRPELYTTDLQGEIAYDEMRAALWSMAPNPGALFTHEASSNDFLAHSDWWTVGVDAAWDLMSLPRKFAQRRAARLDHELAAQRRKALAFGVLNQVRLSLIERAAATKELRLADEYHAIQSRLVEALQRRVEAGQAREDDLFKARVEQFLSQVRLVEAHEAYRRAEVRLTAALGRDPGPPAPTGGASDAPASAGTEDAEAGPEASASR